MECPGEASAPGAAVALLQARYALPIVGALLVQPLRFNALQRAVGAPSAATLRLRLGELTHAGVTCRDGDTYHLTAPGKALQPVFDALAAFTTAHPQHDPQVILDVLGHRHAMPVMRELRGGPLGFNELQRAVGAPSATTLTRRLTELEGVGLLDRTPHPDAPGRTRYQHSPVGEAFSPVIGEILGWGARHLGRGTG